MIYVSIHGEDEIARGGMVVGRRHSKLTELGEKQAVDLAHGIKSAGIAVDVIYGSPLNHAYNTAKIVAKELGVVEELYCLGSLIERDKAKFLLSLKREETFPELLDRVKRLLKEIELLRKGVSENVLLVTHEDVVRMIYSHFYNLKWWETRGFNFNCGELLILSENCEPDARILKIKQG